MLNQHRASISIVSATAASILGWPPLHESNGWVLHLNDSLAKRKRTDSGENKSTDLSSPDEVSVCSVAVQLLHLRSCVDHVVKGRSLGRLSWRSHVSVRSEG